MHSSTPEYLNRRPSFWERDAGPAPCLPELTGRVHVDVAVIGAGITGISCALHLLQLRPHLRVCVLEAGKPGSGATSRSSGFLMAESPAWERILEREGSDSARKWNAFSSRGLDALRRSIERWDISCDLQSAPFCWVGTSTQLPRIRTLGVRMDAVGIPYQLQDAARLKVRIGGAFYAAGLERQGSWRLHPGKLMQGLALRAGAAGIAVHGGSLVLQVVPPRKTGALTHLMTTSSEVIAKQVLFATNAFTPKVLPWSRSRVLPIQLAALATRPMTHAERAQHPPVHFREVQTVSRTFGTTPDHRVFMRGVLGYRSNNECEWPDDGAARSRLEQELRARLPWTQPMEVAFHWTGPVAVTVSGLPIAGALETPGQFLCVGCCGVGLVSGFHHGMLMAHLMVGEGHSDLHFLRGIKDAGWIAAEPWRTLGVRAYFYFALGAQRWGRP